MQVDYFGQANAFQLNAELEFSRNKERYAFLRWGQNAFRNFRVVPPDTGIVHQVNLEYLARVVCTDDTALTARSPIRIRSSAPTRIRRWSTASGVVGWGVGGIEAEAAMLGQPISMLIPPVLGFRLTGTMREGTTATDLVLTITERLRKHGVVGKFVEFFGAGLAAPDDRRPRDAREHVPGVRRDDRDLPDRRDDARLPAADRPRGVARRAGRGVRESAGAVPVDAATPDPIYTETIELDLNTIEPSLAGPRRPQDRVALKNAKSGFNTALPTLLSRRRRARAPVPPPRRRPPRRSPICPAVGQLEHGSVVIAAITSCTNTSNPSVMIAAGLVAKKAVEQGLERQPWVKTSLAPGSKVVTEYLRKAGLDTYLDRLGFNLVGYGCTTCIGNSGPLPDDVSAEVEEREPGGRLGPQRQPQLRRPHSAAGARQLPRIAAAGRRLRARRHA